MTDVVHRRHDPLLDEWVLVSPHRGRRPWQGQEEAGDVERPRHAADCHLCPGNIRAGGPANPDYDGIHVFDNDFPALLSDPEAVARGPGPEPSSGAGSLLRSAPAAGVCRVLCFGPRHDLTLAEVDDAARRAVIDAWVEQTRALGERWAWVQCFENKGAMMGCSSPHPHGQIWALDAVPTLVERETRTQRAHHATHGSVLLLDAVAEELESGERIVARGDDWVALVPYWARWPFEILLLPRTPTASLADLTGAARDDLARVLGEVLRAYDNLFECDFPYSLGWHGAPPGADATTRAAWQLHGHIYPPLLRSATVRKFMVGFEMLAEAQRDLTPEDAAERLRRARGPHWRRSRETEK